MRCKEKVYSLAQTNEFVYTSLMISDKSRLKLKEIFSVKNLIAGVLFSVSLKLFSARVADYDLFGHLKVGELLLNDFSSLKKELFSFTAKDALVINHEWLSQMVLSGIYNNFGAAGLIILKALVGLLSSFLIFKAITKKTGNIIVAALVFLIATQALARGFLFRPQIFSYLLLSVLAYIFATRETKIKRARFLFAMPIIFLLWVNLHGAFIAGLGFLFLFLITEARALYTVDSLRFYKDKYFSQLAFASLAAFIVTFANPYGMRLYSYIAREMTLDITKRYIMEWQPATFTVNELPFFMLLALYVASLFLSKRKITLKELLIPSASATLGLTSVRHTPIFAIMASPTIAERLGDMADRFNIGRDARDSNLPAERFVKLFLASVMALFLYLATGPALPKKWEIYLDYDPYPVYTVKFIKENKLKGNIWLPHNFGTYAIYYLYPDCKVSIDWRWTTVYPKEIMQDAMDFSFSDDSKKKFEIAQKYAPDIIITEAENDVNALLDKSESYRFLYRDSVSNLYVRADYKIPAEMKLPDEEEYLILNP